MSTIIYAADITCPQCNSIGPCRNAVRNHNARTRRARELTYANELAEKLGFTDGIPALEELEMMATLGHEEDKPIAAELIELCEKIGAHP